MLRIYSLIIVFIFISFPVKGDALNEEEKQKLFSNKPNIIAKSVNNRSLQIWILTSDGRGVIWCEAFINEDKSSVETICFDDKDPDN